MSLDTNNKWPELPTPQKGDMVILHYTDGFDYHLQVIVDSVEEGYFAGTIKQNFGSNGEAIDDGQGGNSITFNSQNMFDVVKKP